MSVFFLSACCWQLSCRCLHLAAAFLLQAGFSIAWWGGEPVDVVAHFCWSWEPLPFSHGCVCGLGRHSPAIFNVARLVTDISSSTSAWSTVEARSGHPGIWPTGFSASRDAASSSWCAGLVLGQAGGRCPTSTPAQLATHLAVRFCVFFSSSFVNPACHLLWSSNHSANSAEICCSSSCYSKLWFIQKYF